MTAKEMVGYEMQKKVILLYYRVFNVGQTANLPASFYSIHDLPTLSEPEKDDRAEKLIEQTKARIRHLVSDQACYNYVNDVIFLPDRRQFKGKVLYYATALHELAHWTGHHSRLNRNLRNIPGSDEYAKEELVAELCAAFLCSDLGFSLGITNNAAYIQNWLECLKQDSRFIFRVIRDAESAANYVKS